VVDEQKIADRKLSKELKDDFRAKNKIIKLLLLGTGESGKSTIVKQMKIINNKETNNEDGYPEEEKRNQIGIIRKNVLDSIEQFLLAADHFGYTYEESEARHARERILKTLEDSELESRENLFSESLASDICVLWDHPSTQLCLERKNDIQVLDSGPYFLNKARQISQPDYLPSDEDVLRARSQTTGIITFKFEVKNTQKQKFDFELIDVGGQRTERKKWIHCFEDVTAVLFIISLSDYNQTLYEDETTNRMQESEKVFGEMLNNIFFKNTPFIVFFNKFDLFKEKIKTTPLTLAYKDYSGPQEYEAAYEFLRNKFLGHEENDLRSKYDFKTTATDTTLVRNVLDSVQTIVINQILEDLGLN